MKRPAQYGWSPEQLARINARREARGQQSLLDTKMGRGDYVDRYAAENEKYSRKKGMAPAEMEEEDMPLSQKMKRDQMRARAERESRQQQFKSKFSNPMKPMQRGVSTPSMEDSYSRFVA